MTGLAAVFDRPTPGLNEPTTYSQLSGVIGLSHASPTFLLSLRRVADLMHVPDDWDSYGSPRIQRAAAQRAVQVLSAAETVESTSPQIVPVSGGGLQIEWAAGSRELEIEMLPDGSVEYLIAEGEQTYEAPLSAKHIGLFVPDLVRWVSGAKAYAAPVR